MSWTKLAAAKNSALSNRGQGSSGVENDSSSPGKSDASSVALKNVMKRISKQSAYNIGADRKGSGTEEKRFINAMFRKRLSLTQERSVERNSPQRSSDGSIGTSELELMKISADPTNPSPEGERGMRKLSMAMKKLGKAQFGLASLLSAASIAQSASDKRPKLVIWPEWNDADVNSEKWDMAHKGKEKDKGKSPVVSHSFDDPEGKIEMPSSLKVDNWKRPQDFITEKTPVVVDPDGMSSFDLISQNEHLHESELMRYIISQINALWEISAIKNPTPDQVQADPSTPFEEETHTWRPWEHIYAISKVQKGPHVPPFNPYGKYAVRLYWMGCWRKIIVDDTLPCDENDRLLLPCTTMQQELWPMLLTKALVKVAALDYTGGNSNCEFGDVSIINCLTGWLPEHIPLQYGHINEVWELLKTSLPEWKLPLQEWEKAQIEEERLKKEEQAMVVNQEGAKDDKSEKDSSSKDGKLDSKDGKPSAKDAAKDKGAKDSKEKEKSGKESKDKKGDKDKDKKADNVNEVLQKRGQSRIGSSRKVTGSRLDHEPGDSLKRSAISRLSNRTTDTNEEQLKRGSSRTSNISYSMIAKKKSAAKLVNRLENVIVEDEEKNTESNVDDKNESIEEKLTDETPIPEHPEVIVFASYRNAPKYPCKVSMLGESADTSERLRQNGLSYLYPHPVLVTQTRSCPLEPPPPPEKIPAWKLIRPRKKKTTPSDEPQAEPEPPKPIQCLEITSPFVNYKVSPVPIPTDTHRPRSALERGATRSRPGTGQQPIEETDENAPEPELEPEPIPQPIDEPQPEPVIEDKPPTPVKAGKGGRRSVSKKEQESSPKLERKGSTKGSGKERVKSASKPGSREGKREDEKTKEKDGKLSVTPTQQLPQIQLDAPGGGDNAGGLAPPPDNGDMEGTEQEGDETEKAGPTTDEEHEKAKKVWIDFEQFCKCFKTLYIYHKPGTYICSNKHSDLKSVAPQPAAPTKGDKKSAPNTSGVNASPSKTAQTPSHLYSVTASPITNPHMYNQLGASQGVYDDKAPYYMFVDNLHPTEIVVSFSSLSRWPEPPPPPVEEKKSHTSMKGGKDKVDDKEVTNMTSSSLLEGSIGRETTPPVVQPGTLVAEPYSWKSLVTGQPILRLRTTSIRAAVLCLPAGRHVLKFMMTGPLGYHVHLCSSTQFVFGDEETVMTQLTKESCRFVDNASQVIHCIGRCINSFTDPVEFKKNWNELTAAHCPYQNDKQISRQQHFKIFAESLYATLRKVLREIASPEIAFAWRAFMFDATTKNILSIPSGGSRPTTGHTSHRGSAKHPPPPTSKAKQPAPQTDGEPEKTTSSWDNRTPTIEEQNATVRLQKQWKGYWVRKIKAARTAGSEENLKVSQNLLKCWSIIEQNLDPNSPDHPGLYLFRYMFKLEPDLMVKYPFYKDEWNKISYSDYKGQFPDQSANTWFVVFREVFHASEEMLAVPKLYVPINTCMLRVINNDTGEEIQRVFQRVAPYVYKKNKKGYTFVAEARTTDQAIQAGLWRMRIIGSLSPLPAPLRNEVNCNFTVKEIRDYYVPNNKNIIFRYAVKVTEDHLTSIQMNTSKSDVHIKLSVLNNEEEVASTIGKGHAVIPAFTFLKDINPDEEVKRSTSRASNKGDSKEKGKKTGKRGGSGKSNDGRGSRGSHHSEGGLSDGDLEERDLKPHKYIIEAQVLKDSWPLSEASWAFVQMLREMEKNELKVAFKEKAVEEPPKAEKTPAASDKGGKGGKGSKGGKDKKGDKDVKGSRPPSQQFDLGKPHWTLRVVSDASAAEDIEVKKDTERADEIRALKKAWEDAEPGRAAKAMQSRLKYLADHTIKVQDDEEVKPEDGEARTDEPTETTLDLPPQTPGSYLGELDDGALTLEPPTPPTPKEVLQSVDITPFLKKGSGPMRYLDDEESIRKMQEQQQQIAEYKAFRQQVEQWREQDKQIRNMMKEKQLQEAEELQVMLDAARESINKPREAFRQKYLEAERKRLEEIEAQEAKLKADAEAKSPKGKKNSAKGKKSPTGKKKK